ncbi:NUMOD4 domain-containing protein [Mycobacteroides abscessus]|uniref:NUMOD4 domain-containing protein n=1 Tax=Mycobacteroides abscessus TaxID=36809 RepID=UPI002E205678|nr:NUMOD4 domain-containing protein [Mycobacteroides abscessus]
MEEEVWRFVPGHWRYFVSSQGQVYSFRTKRILKPDVVSGRYPRVDLDGKQTVKVHHLVAAAFLGLAPKVPLCFIATTTQPTTLWTTSTKERTATISLMRSQMAVTPKPGRPIAPGGMSTPPRTLTCSTTSAIAGLAGLAGRRLSDEWGAHLRGMRYRNRGVGLAAHAVARGRFGV